MYGFDLTDETCLKILQYAESTMQPILILDTFEGMWRQVHQLSDHALNCACCHPLTKMVLQRQWAQRLSVNPPFKDVVDLSMFVVSALIGSKPLPKKDMPALWWNCCKALYGISD